jgi:excisionase family DNA binding protein
MPTLDEYRREIEAAEVAELPAIIGAHEAAKALAWSRLSGAQPPAPAQPDPNRLLTMRVVAMRLGIGEWNAREMGRRGEIPTVRVGGKGVRVRESALNEYIRKNERGVTMSRGR